MYFGMTPEGGARMRLDLADAANDLTLPVIVLSKEAEEAVAEWSSIMEMDKDKSNSLWEQNVLQEGFLEVASTVRGRWGFYFKFEDHRVRFALIQDGVCIFFWEVARGNLQISYSDYAVLPGVDIDPFEYADAMTYDTFVALYFLREYYMDKDLVERTETRVVKKKKKGTGSKGKVSYTYVRKVKYELMRRNILRTYKRKTGSWPVWGHWRKVKPGKVAWVKQHIKGTCGIKVRKYRLK